MPPVALSKDGFPAGNFFCDAVGVAEAPCPPFRKGVRREEVHSQCISGFGWEEDLVLSSELPNPAGEIGESIVVSFHLHQEIIGWRVFTTEDVVRGLLSASHRAHTIFHGHRHQVNRLMVDSPRPSENQGIRCLQCQRNARPYFITLNSCLPIILEQVTSTDIEREFWMQLPFILQKRLEFVASILKIDSDWLIDVDSRLSFLHVIIVLRC